MKNHNYKKIISLGILIAILNYSSAFSNYLFHLISGRILTIDSFGQLESLINLNTIIGMLTGAIGPSIILFFSKVDDKNIKKYLIPAEKKIFIISLITSILLLILYLPLKFFLKIQPTIYIIWVIQVIASIFYLFYLSIFQSKLKLILFALSGLLFSIIKNVFSILFSFTTIRIYGPYLSPAIATIISVILFKIIIAKLWPSQKYIAPKSSQSFSIWKYSLSTLLTNTFLTFIITLDIFIVRYYFSETISGVYSSASVIGKIILYTVCPITVYLFPIFIKYRNNIQKLKFSLYTSTLVIIILTIIASIIYRLYPNIIINLLLGSKFSESIKIIPAYAIFISIYAVLFHICQFLLSQESSFSYKIPITIVLSQSLLLYFFHQNPNQVVAISSLSIISGSTLLLILTLLGKLSHRILSRPISRVLL